MTLLYLEVTQQDLQREFHLARQHTVQHHLIPKLALSNSSPFTVPDLPGIRRALAAVRHLLEMFRRQIADENTSRRLHRLDKRLFAVACELNRLIPPEK